MNSYITRIRLWTIDKALINKIVIEASALAFANEDFAKWHENRILYNHNLHFTEKKTGTWTHRTWLCYEFVLGERATTLMWMEQCLLDTAKNNGVHTTTELLEEPDDESEVEDATIETSPFSRVKRQNLVRKLLGAAAK